MIEFNIGRIRELKGAPLAVFNLLLLCAEPVSQAWLERWSGYSDKPIQQAVNFLKEKGLIQSTPDGWYLSDELNLPELIRNISDPIISINDLDLNGFDLESTNNKDPRKNSDSQAQQVPLRRHYQGDTPEKAELWQILRSAGIHRNDRTRALLKMEHISADYLRSKLEEYRSRGLKWVDWTGLFIRALEDAEPAPERAPNGHLKDCNCPQCAVRNFMRR